MDTVNRSIMEKPHVEVPVQKPVAMKNVHDIPIADAHDSYVLGLRGTKPIVHFGGCTVKKLPSPDSNVETTPTAFSTVGKQQQQQQQHPRRDRDRDKGDADAKAGDSSSVNTTEDSASIVSHLTVAASDPTVSITAPPSIPRVNFDDLCLQHVVGGGGFGQVSLSQALVNVFRSDFLNNCLFNPSCSRCGKAPGWAPLWQSR